MNINNMNMKQFVSKKKTNIVRPLKQELIKSTFLTTLHITVGYKHWSADIIYFYHGFT